MKASSSYPAHPVALEWRPLYTTGFGKESPDECSGNLRIRDTCAHRSRAGHAVATLYGHDAGGRGPHRTEAVPAGQDCGRRVRGTRAGSHPGGGWTDRRAGRCAVPVAPGPGAVSDPGRASAADFRAIYGARRRAHARQRRQHAHGRHEPADHFDHQRHGGVGAGGGRSGAGPEVQRARTTLRIAFLATAPPAAAIGTRG